VADTSSRRLWPVVGVGVVLALVVAFLVVFDWRAVLAALGRADPGLVVAAVGSVTFAILAWAESQRRLLARSGAVVPPLRCVLVYAAGLFPRFALPVGYASSMLVLARLFQRESDLSYEGSLAVVSIAEGLSFAASTALAVAGGTALLVFPSLLPPAWRLPAGLALGAGAVTLPVALAWYRQDLFERFREGLKRAIDRVGGGIESRLGIGVPVSRAKRAIDRYAVRFFQVSEDRGTVAVAFFLAGSGWLAIAGALYASALAVDLALPAAVVLFVVSAAGYANVLPIPGGLGGYEAVGVGALSVFSGAAPETAVAAILLFRAASYWFPLAVGGLAATYLSVDALWVDLESK
jgi:uncharacterized protein (TIRG00374 family)